MKIAVLTLGCRTNQAESSEIEQVVSLKGHQLSDLSDHPDLCIINTCTVTAKADYQSRQLISKALKAGAEVIVTGCYSQLNRQKIEVDGEKIQVIQNDNKSSIINLIPSHISSSSLNKESFLRHRPVIKVQDGCNNACSYCIIPKARGRSRSIGPEYIIEQIRRYESLGLNEIVLSGIHLGMYGRDLSESLNLAQLIKVILDNTGIGRIRLSSLEIVELTPDLLDAISSDRICKHLHLPLQSGDDEILKKMNRSYDFKRFRDNITKIRDCYPDMAIGTDVIVGFPGEGDAEYNNTKKAIESLSFSYIHVFPYSIRPGTKAASMADQVKDDVKKRRVLELREIGRSKKADFIVRNINTSHQVVIESASDEGIYGTTSNFIRVRIPTRMSASPGTLVRVRITDIEGEIGLGIADI